MCSASGVGETSSLKKIQLCVICVIANITVMSRI